jgi:hypothetical protein
VSAAECDALIAHAVAIGAATHARPPSPEEAAALRDELAAELGPACLAGSREAYACAIAAPDLDALAACAAPP